MNKAFFLFLNCWLLLVIGSCKKDKGDLPSQVTAEAGENQTIDISFNPGNCGQSSSTVQLDGSKSSASVGTIVYSEWSYVPSHQGNTGGNADIISPNNLKTTVVITTPGSYWFKLKVYNDQQWIDEDEVNITVAIDTSKGTKTVFLYPENLGTIEGIAPVAIVTAGQKVFVQYYRKQVTPPTAPTMDMFKVYDLVTKSWSDLKLPTDRRKSNMVSIGDKLVCSGGYGTAGLYAKADVLDVNTGSWSSYAMPGDFVITNAVAAGGRIFYTGYDEGGSRYSDRLEIFDLNTKTVNRELLSQKRNFCNMIPAGDLLYFNDNPDFPPYTNLIDIYNLVDHRWSRGLTASGFTGAHGVAIGGKVYFYGGEIHEKQNNRVAVWDPYTSQSEYLCMGGYFYSIYPYDDQLLFFRRYQGDFGYGNSEFEKYDPATGKWIIGKIANADIQVGGVGTIYTQAGKSRIIAVSPVNYPDSRIDFISMNPLPDYTFWDIEF